MFSEFKSAVTRQWQRMAPMELYRTGVDKDAMWETYLASFPEGSNPLFRKRREHDCSCCRQFIRSVGSVVAIVDGKLASIWDIETPNAAYQAVADAMSALVKSQPIDNWFLHTEASVGTDKNYEGGEAGVLTWQHFHVRLPNSRVCHGTQIGPRLSDARAAHDVLLRSLHELTIESADTVLDLIARNDLYRGEEHRHAVASFRETKLEFDRLPAAEHDNFAWTKAADLPAPVARIRNTSIGQLLVDLSEGMDEEAAVRRFEAMVAPANYKRPTAPVTKAMIERAKATVEELGLTTALERRYATLADISVNNVLFADRNARKVMAGGGPFDDLASTGSPKAKNADNLAEIGIEAFLTDILPGATSLELLVENGHQGNLVSLIAPADSSAREMFKWDNRFSWSYHGDMADSLKERIKRAGGNVTGDLCCRLAWYNTDDLDLHMHESGGSHIYFGDKVSRRTGGQLDVDMNVGGETREPVENIFYGATSRMPEGIYRLFVHQFRKREVRDVGFEAEVDFRGAVLRFAYERALLQGENVTIAEFNYTHRGGVEITKSLPSTVASRKIWGIDTEAFHRVSCVMLSPNHWDGHGVGNRHWFFMLAGCKNDGSARGFYNEFLTPELDKHRKVLELVGAKMRAEEAGEQLSGVGFSSTQRNHAVVRVSGGKTVRVTF